MRDCKFVMVEAAPSALTMASKPDPIAMNSTATVPSDKSAVRRFGAKRMKMNVPNASDSHSARTCVKTSAMTHGTIASDNHQRFGLKRGIVSKIAKSRKLERGPVAFSVPKMRKLKALVTP